MIAHAQKDAMMSNNITIFTVNVARANNPHMEKSISCASASVSASICLLFSQLAPFLGRSLPTSISQLQGKHQHNGVRTHVFCHVSESGGGYSPAGAQARPPRTGTPR